jgi:hypothetical protein
MLPKMRRHRGVYPAPVIRPDEAVPGIGEALVSHFLLPQRQGLAELITFVLGHARFAVTVQLLHRRHHAVDVMDG